MSLLAMTFSLFLLMDSVGNVPLFLAILKDIPRKRQLQIIFRELLIALLAMITFHFLGEALLSALQIQQYAILVSGGIILFLLSLKMIFPSGSDAQVSSDADKEPFIVPLAIPLVAGPAVLATIILYSHQESKTYITITAIILAWAISTVILLSSTLLDKVLGRRGILATERLMGLILTMMSVQMFMEGISQFIQVQ